jgi:iron complex transport system substrate-binding protein
MRIVSLEPFLTELVCHFGRESELVGVSHRCDTPEAIRSLPRVTSEDGSPQESFRHLSRYPVQMEDLAALRPDIVLTSVDSALEDTAPTVLTLTEGVRSLCGNSVRILSYAPRNLDGVFEMFERLGKDLGSPGPGHELAQRSKAQLMDWADNFYERMKNKRVAFVESVDPFELGGYWIPDVIRLASATSMELPRGQAGREVTWDEIVAFKPDVIIVAPRGFDVTASARLFKRFEKLPGWEDVSAVKRGEVVFAPGLGLFDRPGPRIRDAMAILISAIAGLDSGYITPRDSFYRLRWVELQRHRF